VEEALRELPVSTLYNPEFETGEMISSVRVGLQAFDEHTAAVLIALGDQPQIQAETIGALIRVYRDNRALLIVPSYQMRRGHPWLVSRELWQEIMDLHPPQTLRDFLERQAANIQYLVVDTASVLQDIDTPEQYEQYRPE
jgi:molybdenum cofactor cytidylyltransferase